MIESIKERKINLWEGEAVFHSLVFREQIRYSLLYERTKHRNLYEDGRHYQRDSEVVLNRGVGPFERMRAVHLPHNDLNHDWANMSECDKILQNGRP